MALWHASGTCFQSSCPCHLECIHLEMFLVTTLLVDRLEVTVSNEVADGIDVVWLRIILIIMSSGSLNLAFSFLPSFPH